MLHTSICRWKLRRENCLQNKVMDQMVDKISILPNDLLCHILSFLPIRQAFQTSVLSKQWTPLCYSLSVLRIDFDYEIEDEAFVRFCRFVDTIMLSPCTQPTLQNISPQVCFQNPHPKHVA